MPQKRCFYGFFTYIFEKCCYNYLNMVMFGSVYCLLHHYCMLDDIILKICKVFHHFLHVLCRYDWLRLVKTGPVYNRSRPVLDRSWSRSFLKRQKDRTGPDFRTLVRGLTSARNRSKLGLYSMLYKKIGRYVLR
jgi:hypothetical protein